MLALVCFSRVGAAGPYANVFKTLSSISQALKHGKHLTGMGLGMIKHIHILTGRLFTVLVVPW